MKRLALTSMYAGNVEKTQHSFLCGQINITSRGYGSDRKTNPRILWQMKRTLWFLLVVVFASTTLAQSPKAANTLVSQVRAEAVKAGKVPFVRFTASWCGWCHKMQGVLDKPEIKTIWDKYFISVPIVVLENGEKEKLENPGGEALMESVGGKDQGIPFFYFVDPKSGKMIVNSLMPAAGGKKTANVGCPYEPAEVAFFMDILRKAAPKMTDAERAKLNEAFGSLKAKDKSGR